MSDLAPVAVAGALGILGTLGAVWLAHVLQRRSRQGEDALSRELRHLDAVEAGFKGLSSELINELFVPNPFSGRKGVTALRELMYAGPVMLPSPVVKRFLDVYHKAAELRSYRALARRWLFGDISQAKVFAIELAAAESAIAAAIATCRQVVEERHRPSRPRRSSTPEMAP